MKNNTHLSLLFCIALTFLSPQILAQGKSKSPTATIPAASPVTATPPTPVDAAVSLTQIADQATNTQKLIERLKPLAAQPLEFEELIERLGQAKKQLTVMQSQTSDIINDRKTSIEQIRASQSQWSFIRDQLTKDQQKIRDRGTELEDAIVQLTSEEQAWKLLQSKIKAAPDLNYDGNSLKTATANISTLRKQLSIPIQEAITLEQEWQNQIDICDDAQTSLKNDETSLRSNLLGNLQSPIWDISSSDFQTDQSIQLSFTQQIRLLSHYSSRYSDRFIIIFFVIACSIFFLYRLNKYSQAAKQNNVGLSLRLSLLDRPISSITALSIFLTLIILPYPPQLLKSLLILLLFIPVARLSIPRLPPPIRILAWLVCIFFIFNDLSTWMTTLPALQRLWIFGSAIVGFLGCIHVLLHAPSTNERKTTLWRILRITVWLALFTTLASMIGDALGAVVFSQFLIAGIAYSAYTALCLVALDGTINDIAVAAIYMPASELSHLISSNRSLLVRYTNKLTTIVFSLFWFYFTLSQFSLWDGVVNIFLQVFSQQMKAGSISISLGDILSIVFTIWLSFKISQLLRFILMEDIAPRTNMVRGAPEAIGTLMQYFIVLIGFIIAISFAGIDASKLAIMAGALGVGIGIGLQDVVNNFTSGLILLFEQNIKVADTVQCGLINGRVMHIGLRCSIIKTSDGAEVIVPNGKLASDQVINWTRSGQERRITVTVSAINSTNPQTVIDTLLTTARSDKDITDNPPPAALFINFGPGTMNFELRAWVDNGESIADVNSRLCIAIADAFNNAGLNIPVPQHDVYIKQLPASA